MKLLALLLICVAVFDVTMSIIKLIPERKAIIKDWKYNKRQFIPLIYSIICSLLAIIVFVDYLRRG